MEPIVEPTQAELSAIVTAIAEQVDVVQSEAEDDVTSLPSDESETPETEPQRSGVERSRIGALAGASEILPAGPAPETALPPDQLPELPAEQTQEDDEGRNDTGLYLFWSPFRSTWAAEGFAGRLTVSTQVPVDVVTTAPGEHRVAFSYRDETERLARIQRIESVTGLKLE